jgi:hypothetical protein
MKIDKAVILVAVWAGPAFVWWTTGNPWVAVAFVSSFYATAIILEE